MKPAAPAMNTALIGWQTLLADLSLILFMVTAAAMSTNTHRPAKAPPKIQCSPAVGEPLALWRSGSSQTLAHWLAIEQPDARQQLTITAHYRAGAQDTALAAAQALAAQAGPTGKTARLIITLSSDAETMATLAYDQTLQPAATGTAQALQHPSGNYLARTTP
jgi:hypothetical protein